MKLLILALCFVTSTAWAEEKGPPPMSQITLQQQRNIGFDLHAQSAFEVEKLAAELEKLKGENEELKRKLKEKEGD